MRVSRSTGATISSRFCFLFDADLQVAGNRVGQARRVVDPDGRDHRVVLQIVRQLDVLLEQADHAAHHGLGVRRRLGLFLHDLHGHAEEALVFLPLHRARALDALDEHLDVAVGELERLHDVRDAPHRVDVRRLRIVNRGVVLGRQEDPLVGGERVFERPGGGGPSDYERHHHVWKDNDVPERDDRKSLVMIHV
jgi:hypothetical protein